MYPDSLLGDIPPWPTPRIRPDALPAAPVPSWLQHPSIHAPAPSLWHQLTAGLGLPGTPSHEDVIAAGAMQPRVQALTSGPAMQTLAGGVRTFTGGDAADLTRQYLREGHPIKAALTTALSVGLPPGEGDVAEQLWARLSRGEGFTLTKDLVTPKFTGYLVADRALTKEGIKSAADIRKWLAEPEVQRALEGGGWYGGWGDEINISRGHEVLGDALHSGAEGTQKAIGQMENGTYIRTIDYPKIGHLTLEHRSPVGNLTEVDPAKFGTGPVKGAELKRQAAFPELFLPRSYFSIAGSPVEAGFEHLPVYTTHIPVERIYDLNKDPRKLWEAAYERATAAGQFGPAVHSRLEQEIRANGYLGYRSGNAVAVFEKVPVTSAMAHTPWFPTSALPRSDVTLLAHSLAPYLLGAPNKKAWVQAVIANEPGIAPLLRGQPALAQKLYDAANAHRAFVRDLQPTSAIHALADKGGPAWDDWYEKLYQTLLEHEVPEPMARRYVRASSALSPRESPRLETLQAMRAWQASEYGRPITTGLLGNTAQRVRAVQRQFAPEIGVLSTTGSPKVPAYALNELTKGPIATTDTHHARAYLGANERKYLNKKGLLDLTDAQWNILQARTQLDARLYQGGLDPKKFQARVWGGQTGYKPEFGMEGANRADWMAYHLASGEFEDLIKKYPKLAELKRRGEEARKQLAKEPGSGSVPPTPRAERPITHWQVTDDDGRVLRSFKNEAAALDWVSRKGVPTANIRAPENRFGVLSNADLSSYQLWLSRDTDQSGLAELQRRVQLGGEEGSEAAKWMKRWGEPKQELDQIFREAFRHLKTGPDLKLIKGGAPEKPKPKPRR